jgi:hypothetical protein
VKRRIQRRDGPTFDQIKDATDIFGDGFEDFDDEDLEDREDAPEVEGTSTCSILAAV